MFIARPSAPIIQTVVSYRRKITLSWKLAENNGGKPVTSMTIQYKPYNTTSQFQKIPILIEKRPVYTITGLRPNTEYHIQLIAVNEIGPSDPSVPVIRSTGLGEDIFITFVELVENFFIFMFLILLFLKFAIVNC